MGRGGTRWLRVQKATALPPREVSPPNDNATLPEAENIIGARVRVVGEGAEGSARSRAARGNCQATPSIVIAVQ